MAPALERQAFDEAAFGQPFYRVTSMDADGLERGIAALRKEAQPFIVDAKTPSDDLASSRRLLSLGFRKVCMQIRLVNDLSGPAGFDQQATVVDTLNWPEDLIAAHARNFVFDRFALDVALPIEGHDRLYSSWIRNSLTSGRGRILTVGLNFLSFMDDGSSLRIDLLSVLDHRQGIGRRLLNSLTSLAKDSGRLSVSTVTECENHAAVQLYYRTGYRLRDFQSVFHLTEPR
jgi:ribosomal protein S18 acetylase RimI-like enzyme